MKKMIFVFCCIFFYCCIFAGCRYEPMLPEYSSEATFSVPTEKETIPEDTIEYAVTYETGIDGSMPNAFFNEMKSWYQSVLVSDWEVTKDDGPLSFYEETAFTKSGSSICISFFCEEYSETFFTMKRGDKDFVKSEVEAFVSLYLGRDITKEEIETLSAGIDELFYNSHDGVELQQFDSPLYVYFYAFDDYVRMICV